MLSVFLNNKYIVIIDMMNINDYAPIVKAYIDPGTGSMLFTVLVGLISAAIYAFKGLLVKIKYFNKKDKTMSKDIIPFAIYSEGKRYWNSFEMICDEFENRKTNVVYMTSSQDDPAFSKGYCYVKPTFIGEGNKAFAKLNFLQADILLATTPGLDVYQWKRSKNVKWYTHIYHSANDAVRYRMFGIDYYDSIICAGDYYIDQIRELENKRYLNKKELLVYGVPYLDALDKRYKKYKVSNNKNNKKTITVLIAPTWGPNSLLRKYDNIVDKLTEIGYKVIIRPHPQSFYSEKEFINDIKSKYINDELVIWDDNPDNFISLCNSDVLISDFSGVIFDYTLVFDKPIIYADVSYDSSIYDACWLDHEMWTFKTLPLIGEELTKEKVNDIELVIDKVLNNKQYKIAREKARIETWSNKDSSAKLIVDYLIKKREKLRGDCNVNN